MNMLNYANIMTGPDYEVRDPVSGYSYPASYMDMKAIKAEKRAKMQARDEEKLASMLSSILK